MNMIKSVRGWVFLLIFGLLFVLSASSASAQSSGTIQGVVKDASGGAVPDAKITVTNTDTTESRTATTEQDGSYRVPALAPGHYTVRIEKEGFKSATETDLTLTVAQNLVVNPNLEVGAATQEVTVTGEAPIINTTTSSLGGLVNDQQIVDLPLNGRNFIDLALLQPGVANVTSNGPVGLSLTWFSSNGAPIRSNMVTLDGAPMMSVKGGTASAVGTTLGVDGIQEYRVLTSAFGAEYGISVGSQIVMVSKGGTNQFHGDVFDYLRNDAMDASGYFAKTRPKLIRNNFGGSVGGPIRKGNTFFYAVYEGVRQRQATTSTINTLLAGCHVFVANPCATASGGVVNAAIQPLLQLYPLPNVGTSVFSYNPVTPVSVDYGQIRVDHSFSAKDSMFGRYTTDDSSMQALTSYAGTPYQNVGTGTTGQDIFASVGETHIFSPNVLNTLRFSYSRTKTDTTALFPSLLGQSQFALVSGQAMGGITVSSGLSGIGPPTNVPQQFDQNLYTLTDDVYYTKGRHAFKFGTMLNRVEYYTTNSLARRGGLVFNNAATFLAGNYLTATFLNPGSNTQRMPRLYTFGFYAQDDWRLTSRLTLNLGLRYEPDTVPWDRTGANWAFRNLTDPTTTYGPIWRNQSLKNLGPRVGFAWDVRGDGKTSVRAAFGEYFDVNAAGFTYYTTGQGTPPLSSVITLTNQTISSVPLLNGPQDTGTGQFQFGSALHMTQYKIDQPHLLQWNMTIERQLSPTMALSVSYVGTRGIHLWDNEEGNPCLPKSVTANGIPNWGTDTGSTSGVMLNQYNPVTKAYQVNTTTVSHICNSFVGNTPTIATYPGTPVQYVVPTRLNPLWGDDVLLTTGADSFYHGLSVLFTKRVSRGLQGQIAYTFSRSVDDAQGLFNTTECIQGTGGDPIQVLQPERRNFDRGPSCFDIHNNLQLSFLYHFPTLKGSGFLRREVLNGWWVGNKSSWQTGFPFNPVVNTWRSLDQNITSNNLGAGSTDFLSYGTATVGPGQSGPDPGSSTGTSVNTTGVTFVPYNRSTAILGNATNWFNPLMFVMNPIGQLGTATKNNALRGPHLANIDLSLNKDTALPFLGEKGQVEFRVEAFNILNNTNWALPQVHSYAGTLTDTGAYSEAPTATAGQITAIVGNPRQLQLSLKVMF